MQLAELDQWLAERNLNGHWNHDRENVPFTPYVWKWADIHEGLMAAAEVVPMDATGRRTVQMRIPGMGGGMSNTIHMSVQCVLPGEIAKAHRHNAAAIRFVIKGNPNAATVVDGEPFPMGEGDLITTPNWCVHDHYNNGDEPVMWIDGLDVRLVGIAKMLGAGFPADQQPIVHPVGYSAKTLGHAKPSWIKSERPTPAFHYQWADTAATMTALQESETDPDPYDGIHLTFSHPLTGGPTLPTFACEIQLLSPRLETQSHRHLSTTVYYVFRGEGATVVDGERLEWAKGDIFVVPPWTWHSHENRLGEDAILFSMDDWPAITSLGLYREEGKAG